MAVVLIYYLVNFYVLTCFGTRFSRSVHSDFDGFVVSGYLRGRTAHSYGQRKTLTCNVYENQYYNKQCTENNFNRLDNIDKLMNKNHPSHLLFYSMF